MFRKADRDNIWEIGIDVHNANCSMKTVMAQLKSLTEGQDKLMQSHEALEHGEDEGRKAIFAWISGVEQKIDRITVAVTVLAKAMNRQTVHRVTAQPSRSPKRRSA